jgi:hypothetical protein
MERNAAFDSKAKFDHMKLKTGFLTALALGLAAAGAQAQSGTIGMTDVGTPTDNSPADVSQATAFNISDLVSFANNTGVFVGLGSQNFGALSFSLSNPAGLDFGNTLFGTFICTGITVLDSQADHNIDLFATGSYSSGTFDGNAIVGESASVDLGFTQNGFGLADSAVFSIPAVPEPGSLALLGVGATVLGFNLRRRKV